MKRLLAPFAALWLLAAIPAVSLADATHVVRKGDTLAKIARTYHVSVPKIQEANGLQGTRLAVGTKLVLPGAKARPKRKVVAPKADPPVANAGGEARGGPPQLHTVRKDESVRSIARKYDVNEREFRRLNQLRRKARPRPGTQLIVRESVPATYAVREGDSLWRIAKRFDLDADALMELNGLTSEDLQPGSQLALLDPPGSTLRPEAVKLPTEAELVELAQAPKAAETLHPAIAAPQDVAAPPGASKANESIKDRLLRVAQRMLDVPYRFGGTTLWGLDCSGFVQKAFAFLNRDLPRSAREQFREGAAVERADLSPGDLVFFRTYAKYPSHVGIYLGDNRFVHASSRERKVKIDDLEAPYYVKRYIGAKRLLFEENQIEN